MSNITMQAMIQKEVSDPKSKNAADLNRAVNMIQITNQPTESAADVVMKFEQPEPIRAARPPLSNLNNV